MMTKRILLIELYKKSLRVRRNIKTYDLEIKLIYTLKSCRSWPAASFLVDNSVDVEE